MSSNLRKLTGAATILVYVCVYALIAMALAQGRVQELPKLGQTFAYIVLGLVWILPLMPLIKWMQKPDRPASS